MCFVIHPHCPRKQVAKEDIPCWKVVKLFKIFGLQTKMAFKKRFKYLKK